MRPCRMFPQNRHLTLVYGQSQCEGQLKVANWARFLRILHFYKTYFPDSFGGIEQFIFQLAHGSAKRGIDVEVLSMHGASWTLQAEMLAVPFILLACGLARRVDAGQKKQ